MTGPAHVDYQYKHFKATVPERKIFVGIVDQLEWRYYDTNPKSSLPPLVCLGGVAATADVFYKQLLALSARGYRALAVDPPAIWTQEKFVKGFDHFLDALRVHQVHLYGTSLGGFLFQIYAQNRPRRVLSLVLSNAFLDTRAFHSVFGPWAPVFPWAPDFMLKRLVLSGLREGPHEPLIADSIDFVVARMEKLSRAELASRLSLNTQLAAVSPLQLPDSNITIMDCNDFASVPGPLRDALYQRYPEARRAFLKSGGDFPFLSRADEVNLHLLLHLRRVEAAHEGVQDDELMLHQQAEEVSVPAPSRFPTAFLSPSVGKRSSIDDGGDEGGDAISVDELEREVGSVDMEEHVQHNNDIGPLSETEPVGDPLGVSTGSSLIGQAPEEERREGLACDLLAKNVGTPPWREEAAGIAVETSQQHPSELPARRRECLAMPEERTPLAEEQAVESHETDSILSPESSVAEPSLDHEDMGSRAREWLRGVEEEHWDLTDVQPASDEK